MRATIIFLLVLSLNSCAYFKLDQKSYKTFWQDNSLYIVMPHPSMGIVGPGVIDWRGVELDEVIDDIYSNLINSNLSGNVNVFIRFEYHTTDKYGNETLEYDDHQIATIPMVEARKYQYGVYLDNSYNLKQNIYDAAFGNCHEIPTPKAVYNPFFRDEEVYHNDDTIVDDEGIELVSNPFLQK